MKKNEFLLALKKGLNFLHESEIADRLTFYSEMIDDYVEEGLTEEEAINKIGNIDKIIEQNIIEAPLNNVTKEKIKPQKKYKVWEIVLIVLGSPLWLSLLIAGVAVILSLYIVMWSLVLSMWVAFTSFVIASFGFLLFGILNFIITDLNMGFIWLALSLISAGFGILFYYCSLCFTKLAIKISVKSFLIIKKSFAKRGEK